MLDELPRRPVGRFQASRDPQARQHVGEAAERQRAHRPTRPWPVRLAQRLFITDVVIIFAVCLTFGIWVSLDSSRVLLWPNGPAVEYPVWMTLVAILWIIFVTAYDTRDARHIGHGVVEYRRILTSSVMTFVTLTVFGFFLRTEMSRLMFFTVLPIGTALLLLSRWMWRQWLRRQQSEHRYVHRALVLGERRKAEHIIAQISRTHGTGFDVIGAVTDKSGVAAAAGVPVLGTIPHLVEVIDDHAVDTLILAGSDELSPREMRRLGWQLADRDIQLVVAPALTDVAGPRVHARPLGGLPLVHVAYPTLEGSRRFGKRAFDIVGSGLLILISSPLLIGVALAVKLSSPGRMLYQQERIGRGGRPFGMLKFRSMVQNADDQLASLLDAQGTSETPLFKVTNDPRITPVGRFLRKHSFDEFPQLFNVFKGEMSLVGPRPQRPAEVALYDDEAHRRLLVKPGMSGLWQVNGRSSLSWEDALRLDLYYIENWSFTQDIIILFRTVKAVIKPEDTAH